MNIRLVAYYLGRLSIGLGLVLIIPTLMAIFHSESDGIAFVITCGLSLIMGLNLKSWGHNGSILLVDLSMQDSIGITGLGWLLTNLLGTLPYILSGSLGILDGIFETVAGFTGCGGTVFNDLSNLSHSILLWRTLTQWLGGLGIIVIFVALLPQTSQSALQLYQAESSRISSGHRRPRLQEMTLVIFKIYLLFTSIASVVYWLVGMTPFAALNHAMATISTGGFSVYNESIAYYKSPLVEMAVIFFMVLSGGNFNLYYSAYKNGPKVLWKNTEFRTYLGLLAFATVFIALSLSNAFNYSLAESFREAAFEAAAQNSTGFVAFDYPVRAGTADALRRLLRLHHSRTAHLPSNPAGKDGHPRRPGCSPPAPPQDRHHRRPADRRQCPLRRRQILLPLYVLPGPLDAVLHSGRNDPLQRNGPVAGSHDHRRPRLRYSRRRRKLFRPLKLVKDCHHAGHAHGPIGNVLHPRPLYP